MHPPSPEPPPPPAAPAEEPQDVLLLLRAEEERLAEAAARADAPRIVTRKTRLSAVLFVLTALSLVAAGSYLSIGLLEPLGALATTGRFPLPDRAMLLDGLVYAGCLLAILLAHEMGHFVQAVRHGVPATLPFFIPFPISPFGTMGAVIVQDGRKADRRRLFDIAISGPLAGLVVALPILWYGVGTSRVGANSPSSDGIVYGNPLLLQWIADLIHGPEWAATGIGMNAPLFAGWVGLFITALNLIPIGQLDGGHILYALVGRKAHVVAYAVMVGAVAWMAVNRRADYAVMTILLLLFGPTHPPTADDDVPLGLGRTVLGWLTLAFVIVGFTPTPIVA